MFEIGKEIRRVLKDRGMTITEFAKRINTHRRNVYDIFGRKSIDTSLLQKIGIVLHYDFFSLYKADSDEFSQVNTGEEQYITNSAEIKLRKQVETLEKEILFLKDRIRDKERIIELMEAGKKK